MITALHCLALYDGMPPNEVCLALPNLPVHQLNCARQASFEKLVQEHATWDQHFCSGLSQVPPEFPSPSPPGIAPPHNSPEPLVYSPSIMPPTPSPTFSQDTSSSDELGLIHEEEGYFFTAHHQEDMSDHLLNYPQAHSV
ncbi:hypothetical protein CTheo_9174 [Ceratobasidium theobromae]|uniref:Uncharacterized protein n=1 Tax=Ceratobasidium theobromae TaxID=1582974 RepID=A0A5N5Q5Y4_9AGAM|nr:hypothetical protein CTheo_9174 [Ceratobasidium theobromae]